MFEIEHIEFGRFPDLLRDGDLLVLNDTRVFPARLRARRATGGAVEVLLLALPEDRDEVPCMLRPAGKIADGELLALEDGSEIRILRSDGCLWVRSVSCSLEDIACRIGEVPLPPYIKRRGRELESLDRERYQTVFARRTGAVAAPTAGLHFDEHALSRIREKGIDIACITLHIGPGTFQPVRTRDVTMHGMMEERYCITADTAEAVMRAKAEGGRVVAVGTTVVRALESSFTGGEVKVGDGSTDLFIYPGYRFNAVDALLTNFHLPRSTLLMLVCAFAGIEPVLAAYREAVEAGYRFYSYGDAMFIE